MTDASYILAGDQYFYTHPQFGVLMVGVVARSDFTGRDDSTPSRISPEMRTDARGDLPIARTPAVAPFSASTTARSHLWVG